MRVMCGGSSGGVVMKDGGIVAEGLSVAVHRLVTDWYRTHRGLSLVITGKI